MVQASSLCVLLLAGGLLLCHSAGDCNNPLFDKSQWPAAYTRPNYLATPTTWQQSSPSMCPEIDSASSCCSTETASDISTAYMNYLGNWYEQWITVDGILQDTFNDFNPVVQQQKLDYGWTVNGSGVTASGSNTGSSTGSSTTTNTTATTTTNPSASYIPEKPDQSLIDAAFSSSPASGVPDSYASIKLTEGDYVWYDFWPYGRSPSRSRTGILKLSNSTQTELRHKANDMNGYMMQLSYYSYQCQNAFKQQMMGMLCMGCDPNWANWVQTSAASINVLIGSDSCSSLYDSCKGFLRLYQDIPALVTAMTAAVKSAVTADPNYQSVSSTVYLSDLDSMINSKSATLCSDKASCEQLLCTSYAVGSSGIFPDHTLISDPAGLATGKTGRTLGSTVTFTIDSNGYDSFGAGAGQATMIIPLMYASETASPGVASDTLTGSRTAPFADDISAAVGLWVSAAFLGGFLAF